MIRASIKIDVINVDITVIQAYQIIDSSVKTITGENNLPPLRGTFTREGVMASVSSLLSSIGVVVVSNASPDYYL